MATTLEAFAISFAKLVQILEEVKIDKDYQHRCVCRG